VDISSLPPFNLYIEVQGGKLAVVSWEPPNIGKISGYFQLATLPPLHRGPGRQAGRCQLGASKHR
jgi:hypothetical protein